MVPLERHLYRHSLWQDYCGCDTGKNILFEEHREQVRDGNAYVCTAQKDCISLYLWTIFFFKKKKRQEKETHQTHVGKVEEKENFGEPTLSLDQVNFGGTQ